MKFTYNPSQPAKGIVLMCSVAISPLPFGMVMADEAQQLATQNFSIPSQSLDGAINTFIEATDWQVGFVSTQTKGIQSQAVQGQFTKEQALRKLLEGTDIQYQFIVKGLQIYFLF